jgi:hypothetical protein
MRAQFVRGVDPKNSMRLGHFDPKTKKNFLSDICQEIMAALQKLRDELNILFILTPGFYFEGPIEEWKTEVALKMDKSNATHFIVWDNGKYIAGVSGDKLIRSEHKDLSGALSQIKKLL